MSLRERILWPGSRLLSLTSDLAVTGVESSGQAQTWIFAFCPGTPLMLAMPVGAHFIHVH